MLNTTTKVINALVGNNIIISHEIQRVSQFSLFNIALLADNMNYLYARIKKKQYGTEEKWFLVIYKFVRRL